MFIGNKAQLRTNQNQKRRNINLVNKSHSSNIGFTNSGRTLIWNAGSNFDFEFN